MVNDKERCEVAAKLRNLDERVLDCREYEHRAICTVIGCWGDGEYSDMELKDRLADLIEPEPERTCTWTWNVEEGYWDCSNCGEISPEDYHKIPNYCPDCGTRIVKKDRQRR